MIIKSIELVGYKRFNLNSIKRLYINFVEKLQIIIGSNGSGKSSLLYMLTPLPAVQQDFEKGGFKKILIENNGSIYDLTSNFENTPSHSFLKNNVELNLGGTLTVQRDIVFKEFGITTDMHELFTGNVKFNNMSVGDRRKWFTLLSNTDYTYAISIYNKLKEKIRDIQGALKINQARLLQENKKLLDPEQEKNAREYIEYLELLKKSLLDTQYGLLGDVKINTSELNNEYNILEESRKDIKNLVRKMLQISKTIDIGEDKTIIDLKARVLFLNNEINRLDVILNSHEVTLKLLVDSKITGLDDTILQINNLNKSIRDLEANRPLNIVFDNISISEMALESVYDIIVNISKDLIPNPDKTYNRDYYINKKNEVSKLELEIAQLDDMQLKLINIIKEIDHIKRHNETECPNCLFIWSRGYNEKDYIEYKNKLVMLNEVIEKSKETYTTLKTELDFLTEYFVLLSQYNRTTASYIALEPLWRYISTNNILYTEPRNIIHILEKTKSLIHIDIEIKSKVEKLKTLETLVSILKDDKNKNLQTIEADIESINKSLSEIIDEKRFIDNQIIMIETIDQISNNISSIAIDMENSINRIDKSLENWLRQETLLYYKGLIDLVNTEIDKETYSIMQIDRQKAIISTLDSQNYQYELSIKTLKILISELSPSEGLIARGMQGFINMFITEINNIIKQIWSYPLELILLGLNDNEDFDLDYKFALKVNDESVVSDIKIASTAMKEVIDLSFKIICMRYLNMSSYPIFLDEFGASMDSAHRHAAVGTIKDLLDNSNFSQIFIISHYETNYNAFTNSQFNILCKNNIVMPRDYLSNSNMVIEV
jgi:energy-coupling factor transporter ATP-binding protein EcfA2